MRSLRRGLERAAWIIGALLVSIWAGLRLHGTLGSRRELARFEAARAAQPTGPQEPGREAARRLEEAPADYRLWSPERVKAYEASRQDGEARPLAVLRIPKIALEVAVLEGTDDRTLDRGVGWIEGTPKPGDAGNVGIAGHRDGFFRGLKDVAVGDVVELSTLDGDAVYRISEIRIVRPEDVDVLDPTPNPSLTLVTCYPFYFVGSAPQRYIVRAEREGPARRGG